MWAFSEYDFFATLELVHSTQQYHIGGISSLIPRFEHFLVKRDDFDVILRGSDGQTKIDQRTKN